MSAFYCSISHLFGAEWAFFHIISVGFDFCGTQKVPRTDDETFRNRPVSFRIQTHANGVGHETVFISVGIFAMPRSKNRV